MADSTVTVVDASAVAALLFNEPGSDDVAERLGRGRLVATSLMPYEVANVCVTKIRRYPDQESALLEAFSMFGALDIELVPVPCGDLVPLARETALTAYDASYLWLARELRADLLTLDHALDSAWRTS
jgi:predicted nucleic acid-binding protein